MLKEEIVKKLAVRYGMGRSREERESAERERNHLVIFTI